MAISRLCSSALVALVCQSIVLGSTTPTAASLPARLGSSTKTGGQERARMTVRIGGTDLYGSGVIVRQLQQGHWLIATTDHVLLDQRREVCVGFSDGETAPAVVIQDEHDQTLDLAFLVIRTTAARPMAVARLDSSPKQTGVPVIAVGFPAGSGYTEQRGILVDQPQQPLRGGYRLAYTSEIQKGMSGGGIFSTGNRLIGLNALHANPLWSAPLQTSDGSAVSPVETARLERHALGLGAASIVGAISRLPSNAIREGMQLLSTRAAVSCRP